MIPELLLLAAAGVINPMDMSDFSMYPSGVKECDKYNVAMVMTGMRHFLH